MCVQLRFKLLTGVDGVHEMYAYFGPSFIHPFRPIALPEGTNQKIRYIQPLSCIHGVRTKDLSKTDTRPVDYIVADILWHSSFKSEILVMNPQTKT